MQKVKCWGAIKLEFKPSKGIFEKIIDKIKGIIEPPKKDNFKFRKNAYGVCPGPNDKTQKNRFR